MQVQEPVGGPSAEQELDQSDQLGESGSPLRPGKSRVPVSPGLFTGAVVVVGLALALILVSGVFGGGPSGDPTLAPLVRPDGVAGGRTFYEPAPPRLVVGDDGQVIAAEAVDPEDETQVPVLAANALFVDPANGSSSNPGSEQAPFRRPADALSVVTPGTTVYFREGVYDDRELGSNVLRRSGTADAWIHLEAYPGERAEIRAGGEWGDGFELSGVSYVSVSGFVMYGHDDSIHGAGVAIIDGSHHVTVAGNYIEGFGQAGVAAVRSSKITIEGNEIRDNSHRSFYQSSGISLFEAEGPIGEGSRTRADGTFDPESFDNIIRGNYVVGNYNGVPALDGRVTDGNCVIIDWFNPVGYQGTTLVENNVCVENGGRGIHVFNASNVVARNNTLVGNARTLNLVGGRVEITAVDGTNIEFYNNLVLNADGVRIYTQQRAGDAVFRNNAVLNGSLPGINNIELSVGANDVLESISGDEPMEAFRPLPDGPIVNLAGHTFQPDTDALGQERPFYGSIGALEPAEVPLEAGSELGQGAESEG